MKAEAQIQQPPIMPSSFVTGQKRVASKELHHPIPPSASALTQSKLATKSMTSTNAVNTEKFYKDFSEHLKRKNQVENFNNIEKKLILELGGEANFDQRKVMVAYSGGKDSSYVLALTRFLQLDLQKKHGKTFDMVLTSFYQPGMLKSSMERIKKIYDKLGITGDEKAKALIVRDNKVTDFNLRGFKFEANEDEAADIKFKAHQSHGDARMVFCDRCNFSLPFVYQLAAQKTGANLVVTGDSTDERKGYESWASNLLKQLQEKTSDEVIKKRSLPIVGQATVRPLGAFFKTMTGIVDWYDDKFSRKSIKPSAGETQISYFHVLEKIPYEFKEHSQILEDIGFKFDPRDLAMTGTESDCFNPLFMMHLFALKMEKLGENLTGSKYTYEEAAKIYFDQHLLPLMKTKEIPQVLIDIDKKRFKDENEITNTRKLIEAQVKEAYGLEARELSCMVYSPFADGAKNLETFLQDEDASELRKHQAESIKAVLAGNSEDQAIETALEKVSGLTIEDLRKLYLKPISDTIVADSSDEVSERFLSKADAQQPNIETVRYSDPYKRIIPIKDGKYIQVTGR